MSKAKQNIDKNAEKIAIIGMSGRFPGAENIEEFWQNLKNGVESVSTFTDQELEASGIDPANIKNPKYVKAGAVLGDISLFDADFFDMSAREAAETDPQHRLLLECAWETLEHAGYAPTSYPGTIGVYAGSRISEYMFYNLPTPDMVGLDVESGQLVTNWKRSLDNDKDTLATRIAYKLNLRGHAITMQTACSTSLVAIHMARQSLLQDECDIILAGGVCLRVPQKAGYLYSEGMIFSPDGHTRTFDAKGRGTVFSSGVAMVALKLLDKAIADGDTIHAVILGSAVNNDGDADKAAFTAPSEEGQIDVIEKALSIAKVDPETVSYVEAHGTATYHGDLVETSALSQAFYAHTEKKGFCAIGSVKTNVGHSLQAAGVVGVIKIVEMMKHKMLVPHLHFENPNPKIDFANSPFYVNTKYTPWKTDGSPRRAGINSLGVGGTNAHLLIEEYSAGESIGIKNDRPAHILSLSAKSEAALTELLNRYKAFFSKSAQLGLGDVCFTANSGRTHFNHRLSLIADSTGTMEQKLSSVSTRDFHVVDESRPKVAFLFSGQGSQYTGMGRQLFETQPSFRENMEKCAFFLKPYLEYSLLDVLYPDKDNTRTAEEITVLSEKLVETIYTQTALFSFEYSLYQLWKSWGIEADFVMGHSIGEFAAACAAGVYSLEEGLKLVAERGRLMQGMFREGTMAAVFASLDQVKKHLQNHKDKISIAAINGPGNIVISGDRKTLEAVLMDLEKEGIKSQPLAVSHAFHSPHVEPLLDSFEEISSTINYLAPKVKIVSNLTGQVIDKADVYGPAYWRRHLREPVMFARSMEELVEQGCNIFVEIGPGTTLLGMGRPCVKKGDGAWLPSLKRGRPEWPQMLKSLASLYTANAEIDWAGFDQDYRRRRIPLPTYPFQRKRYWIDRKERVEEVISRILPPSSHPLLGNRLPSALADIQFETRLDVESTAFLGDHHLNGTAIFPATGYIEMVTSAVSELSIEKREYSIENLVLIEALVLPKNEQMTVQLILSVEEGRGYSFRIFSLPASRQNSETQWKHHVSGRIHTGIQDFEKQYYSLEDLKKRIQNELPLKCIYPEKPRKGITHASGFQAVQKLWQGDGEALAQIQLPEKLSAEAEKFHVHPVLMDAALHFWRVALPGQLEQIADDSFYLPMAFNRIRCYRKLEGHLWSHITYLSDIEENSNLRSFDFSVFNSDGEIVAEVQGLNFKLTTSASLQKKNREESLRDWLYEVRWQRVPFPLTKSIDRKPQEKWIIFSDRGGVAAELIRQMHEQGESCVEVFPGTEFKKIEQNRFEINPDIVADFQKLYTHVLSLPGVSVGVVYLWAVEKSSLENPGADSSMETPLFDCNSGLHLIQTITENEKSELPSLFFVSRGSQPVTSDALPALPPDVGHAPLWGLGRVISREYPKLHFKMIDLDSENRENEISLLIREIHSDDVENQIGFRQQERYVSRLLPLSLPPVKEEKLNIPDSPCYRLEKSASGMLNKIALKEIEHRKPAAGEVEINVRASGLNFRDVLSVLGKYPGNPGPLGRECSGIISAVGEGVQGLKIGDAVLATAPGSFSNLVTTNAHRVVLKPNFLGFDEAAAIPITFLTAYYGLFHLCKIKAGEKVLIHAAAGGVGLAAMQLVKWAGGEIFATASRGKWEFLKSLGIKHIMNSRTLSFADDVMKQTNGKGVDIVLNSLADDFIPKSIALLSPKGRFIEIGKSGIWDADQVKDLRPDISYFPFDLTTVAQEEPELYQSMFQKIIDGYREGFLKPLPLKCFALKDTIAAFRYMAQAKHVGKIVVYQNEKSKQRVPGLLRPDASYLVTGGLGALGLKIAAWMETEGAQNIILLGRKSPSDEAQKVIAKLKKSGVRIHVSQTDVSDFAKLSKTFKELSNTMPPLRGIIHAAGVLDDGVLPRQTAERFAKVLTPKVAGAWNLHLLSMQISLDFFVLYSSVSSLWGNPGQGNYSAANAFMDNLAHYRRAKRLPTVSINWASWDEAGMAANLNENIQNRKKAKGLGHIGLEQGFIVLAKILRGDLTQAAVINVNWEDYLQSFSTGDSPPFFSEIPQKRPLQTSQNTKAQSEQAGIIQQIKAAPENQQLQILTNFVKEETAKMLGLDPGTTLDPEKSLVDLGLDSLSTIELRNTFEFLTGFSLPATMLYNYPTLKDLSAFLAQKIIPENAVIDSGSATINDPGSTVDSNNAEDKQDNSVTGPAGKISSDISGEESPKSMVAIQKSGTKPPFFILHINPLSIHLHLGPDQPVYYFKALWKEGKLSKEVRIEDIAAEHIAEMKEVQPEGPYFIGGFSAGGLIAFEIARQLSEQGEKIAFLFLVEPLSPLRSVSNNGDDMIYYRQQQFSPDSPEGRRYLRKKKTQKSIVKIIDFAYDGFSNLFNRQLAQPSTFREHYIRLLNKETTKSNFHLNYPGKMLVHKMRQSKLGNELPLSAEGRRDFVFNLYKLAHERYAPPVYDGQVVIYKVKNGSKVNHFSWQHLAKGGVEIFEMNFSGHRGPEEKENESEWIVGLKHHLEKAHKNY